MRLLVGPTSRYGHPALMRDTQEVVNLGLPEDRIFENRLPRLIDLDGDGRDEVVVVELQATRGASLVVYGIEWNGRVAGWVERAQRRRRIHALAQSGKRCRLQR